MQWLSVADISRITRIPAPTARRYAALFKEFLPGRKIGRVTKYPEQAVEVFGRIAHFYAEGRVTTEIEELLRADFTRTIEIEPPQDTSSASAGAAAFAPAAASSVMISHDVSRAFADMMDKFSSCLDVIADQKSLIEAQRQDIQKLKTAFVMLARSQKRLKLDQRDLPALPGEMMRKTAELEEKGLELEAVTRALADDSSDTKLKLQILESELVRLRKDRRELERYLQSKIDRLREDLG